MDQLRIAVVGFGGVGSLYARLLRDGEVTGTVLAGICCRNAKGQETIRNEYPGVSVYRNVEEAFLHGEEFDAVVIATPHDSHVAIGKQAFAAGKHVICDKPAGIATKEAKEFLEAWNEAGTAFAMIFNTRTRPAYERAREMIRSGQVGTITRAVWICNTWYRTSCYHQSAPWRSTWAGEHGGLLINQCQHYLDIWQWLFGMPDRLEASIDFGKYNDFDVDDGVELRFLYDGGMRGTLISSSGETPGTNRLEIWGTRGRLTVEEGAALFFDENEMATTEFDQVNKEPYSRPAWHRREISLPQAEDPYQRIFQNFANHVRMGEPLIASGEDGLKGLEMANGGYLSAWLHKTIELPIDDDLYMELLGEKVAKQLDIPIKSVL